MVGSIFGMNWGLGESGCRCKDCWALWIALSGWSPPHLLPHCTCPATQDGTKNVFSKRNAARNRAAIEDDKIEKTKHKKKINKPWTQRVALRPSGVLLTCQPLSHLKQLFQRFQRLILGRSQIFREIFPKITAA